MAPSQIISFKNFRRPLAACLAALISLNFSVSQAAFDQSKARIQDANFGKLPMQFEPNEGQADGIVKFISRGQGYNLLLTSSEAILSVHRPTPRKKGKQAGPSDAPRARVRMKLVGGNPQADGESLEPLSGTVNYFIGNDPKKWHTDIHPSARVRFEKVYPGIDLVYYGNQQHLEYDFIVGPGADPARILLDFSGAEDVRVDADGGLVVEATGGEIKWHKPYAYQEENGTIREIPSRFIVKGHREVQFEIGDYDHGKTLVIDPVMVFASYFGGTYFDSAESIAVDASGSIFITGNVESVNLPIFSAYDASQNGLNDAFLTKFNSTGTALIYSTYLGGSGDDFAYGLAVDSNGNAYLCGSTDGNFPTPNGYQTGNQGLSDGFLSKIGTNGNTLPYSTFLGGSDYDAANAVAVDATGKAYLAGETYSGTGFPKKNNFEGTGGSGQDPPGDSWVAEFDTTISGSGSLIYASYLGNCNSTDRATSIACDNNGNIYVAGEVSADNGCCPTFRTTGSAVQPTFGGGGTDIYVAKVSSTPALVWATFLGGTNSDTGGSGREPAIAIDSSNYVYVVGETSSPNFPTTNGCQNIFTGTGDNPPSEVFVTKLQTNGSSILYSTFLGGDVNDGAYRLCVDKFGCVYVTGLTQSENFPVTPGCDIPDAPEGDNGFITKLNPAVSGTASLIYSSYLGGGSTFVNADIPTSIAVNSAGDFFVCGETQSTNFPVTAGAYRGTNAGSYDGFVAKFSSPHDISVTIAVNTNTVSVNSNLTFTLRVNNNGRANATGVTNLFQIATNLLITNASSTIGTCTTNGSLVTCNLGTLTNNALAVITIQALAQSPGTFTNTSTLAGLETELNTSNNLAALTTTVRGIADVNIVQSVTPNPVFASSNLIFTVGVTNKGPWPATSIMVTDSFPATLQIISVTPSQGTYTNISNVLSCNLGSLANGAGALITVNATALTNGTVTNVATAAAYEADSNLTNNTSSSVLVINPLADLAISGSGTPNPVSVTSNIVYTFIVTNSGPTSASNVVVTDVVPVGASNVNASASQGSAGFAAGLMTANLGTVVKNGFATVTVTLKTTQAGNLTNSASVSSGVSDPVSTNNTAAVVTTVSSLADLILTQRASANPINLTSNLTLTFTLSNAGPSTASGIMLTNILPAALTYVDATSSQGSCSPAGQTVTCNFGSLNSGSTGTVMITVQPNTLGTTTNIGSGAGIEADPSLANNSASLNINVSSLPTLRLSLIGTNAALSWPTSALNFVLQSKTNNLGTNLWLNTGNPAIIGTNYYVTNGVTNINRFYRLAR